MSEKSRVFDIDKRKMKDKKILKIVSWWEKNRLLYNILILIPIVLLMFISSNTSTNFKEVILICLIWIFGANVFYTMSWALEVLIFKHFDKIIFTDTIRIIIFIGGSVFSIIWTFLAI